ncbi:iron-containing alcohol dehydrogenase [Vibrio chagasii]|nr:iron-containing alcohol dehydrogenase [Vibrio chagasii]
MISRTVIADGFMEVWPNNEDIRVPHIAVPTTLEHGRKLLRLLFFTTSMKTLRQVWWRLVEADIAILDQRQLRLNYPLTLLVLLRWMHLHMRLKRLFHANEQLFTDAYGIRAAKLIVENLPVALEAGNLTARGNLLQASTMAISAFYSSLGGIPIHNCAHAFGAISHIPHGDTW